VKKPEIIEGVFALLFKLRHNGKKKRIRRMTVKLKQII
jgi:hypothetical protein